MQKILYLLLLVSVASFGQSGKAKLNNNNDSIYKLVCFTLNDSASAFKFSYYNDEVRKMRYNYAIKGIVYDNKLNFPEVVAMEEPIKEIDSNSIVKFTEKIEDAIRKEDPSNKIKHTVVKIGNNFEAYKLEVDSRIMKLDVLLNMYILKHNNKFIVLSLGMLSSKDSPYYLQEFNKLVNTIRFKQEN